MKTSRILTLGLVLFLTFSIGVGRSTAQESGPSAAQTLGTGFTYQGQLKDTGGSPVTATCAFQFTLWDALSGSTQVGGISTVTGVSVVNGYFTAQVNTGGEFGTGAFNGVARWLQIAVKCTGDAAYTPLSPRQPLTPAPFAAFAQTVGAHNHWAAIWTGNGIGLTLSGGTIGLSGNGSTYGIAGESDAIGGKGLYGYAGAASGNSDGVYGESQSSVGSGLAGQNDSTGTGVYGQVLGTGGKGVWGYASGLTGTTYGVYGRSDSTAGTGVDGYAAATSGTTYGVYGQSDSTGVGVGVYGYASANTSSGSTYGVKGVSNSNNGQGVSGVAYAASGTTYGVFGQSSSTSGSGVYGTSTSASGSGVVANNSSPTGTALTISQGAIRVAGAGVGTNTAVFVHVAHTGAGGNMCASDSRTVINNPLTNGDPNAIVFVTYNIGTTDSPIFSLHNVVLIGYDNNNLCGYGQRWIIYNDDGSAITNGAKFNVLVVKP